jgi:heme/copper-type cytochrome/quinol oxidase subunit 2
MFRFDVIRNQWLILALFSGVVLVIVWFLFYLAMWRNRDATSGELRRTDSRERETARKFDTSIPWIIIFAFVSMAVYAAVFTFYLIKNPPNW